MTNDQKIKTAAEKVANAFAEKLGGIVPTHHVKTRPDGHFLIFEFAKEHDRFHSVLESVNDSLPEDHIFYDRCVIVERSRKPAEILSMPETRLLQKAISESLTIDQYSFEDDFFGRYTTSVTHFEEQITSSGNYIVFGRRGAGKSSLLAYAMHVLKKKGMPYAWVAMQTYSSRDDDQTTCSVISEILEALKQYVEETDELDSLVRKFEDLAESDSSSISQKIDRLIPKVRKSIQMVAKSDRPFTIFLDDFHVIHESLQPRLLNALYSVTRGNNSNIKISGIEQFTRAWDEVKKQGLQSGHDARVLKLDLNLTMPDRSKTHIVGILNAHAQYCGLPSISYLASDEVLSRLVLVAAAVPRDALNLFTQAINKAYIKEQKSVSLTSINMAASEMAEGKLADMEKDTTEKLDQVGAVLGLIKDFCIAKQRKNSFLVKIENGDLTYRNVQKLVALRLVHVLHEGITPHEAGQRFMALMLDYGFYVGIRAAKSVSLFPTEPQELTAKDLRKLPIFNYKLPAVQKAVA